jgi:hypothetical protein
MDQDVKSRFDQHPYGALAASLGVGYVLGGGLFTPLTERIVKLALRAGLRAALVPILRAQLSKLVAAGEGEQAAPAGSAPGTDQPPRQNAA